uniref:Homologous recombination OB-fold protein OB-fold domain-containing protein n=2 Tax=Hyaloperonospora arabidopsidis (strain Emoy2) TaxID=559515 RepID=M4C0X8_HYAAE
MSGSEDENVPPASNVAQSGKRWRNEDTGGRSQPHRQRQLRPLFSRNRDGVRPRTMGTHVPTFGLIGCSRNALCVKMRSLKYTVQSVVDDDEALAKVPQLLVLIKSVRYVEEEIAAVLHVRVQIHVELDPTGEVDGYFHRELVDQLGPALVDGVGVLLYKVSVFTPTDAPVTGRRKSYLNITPRNVQRIFVTKDSSNVVKIEEIVNSFNKEKEDESQHESDQDDYEDNLESKSEQATRQLLQRSTVCDTSAELTLLSQRQVIHRNPPVRDPAVATTTQITKSKRGKSAARKAQDHDSGLGKWQWSKLLRKTSRDDGDESATGPSRTQERQGFLNANSHLVSLITKQNERSRDEGSKQDIMPATARTKKPVNVHFASETEIYPLSMPSGSDKVDVPQNSQSLQSFSAVVVGDSEKIDNNNNSDNQDDDDDDW